MQSLTQVMAPASMMDLLELPWDCSDFFTQSMKCFFLRWRGLHGAPESALLISSRICGEEKTTF